MRLDDWRDRRCRLATTQFPSDERTMYAPGIGLVIAFGLLSENAMELRTFLCHDGCVVHEEFIPPLCKQVIDHRVQLFSFEFRDSKSTGSLNR